MRRHFSLPSDDVEFLDAKKLEWETVIEGTCRRVVLKMFPTPTGYNQKYVDMNMRIEAAYPDTQIDMAYFYPHLSRTDGKEIGALSQDSFDQKTWQRWSRHRTSVNPWRPGVDNLCTHVALINEWLQMEIKKR